MPDRLTSTRLSLHAVAEQLLAGPQHRRTGSIELRVAGDGFTTADLPGEPSRIAVSGTTLVADRTSGPLILPLIGTISALADSIGVEPGSPQDIYDHGSGTDPRFILDVDEASAQQILRALRYGDGALREFASACNPDAPEVPVLWPEHFDVAITVAEVNYGVSPGDSFMAEPYAYVGPWHRRIGPFWDQPFGAARAVRELGTQEAVLAFFETGRQTAGRDLLA